MNPKTHSLKIAIASVLLVAGLLAIFNYDQLSRLWTQQGLSGAAWHKTRVGLQPYADFDKALLDTIQSTLTKTYGFEVVLLPTKKLPASAYTTLRFPRYRADSLIRFLKREKPDNLDYVMGLTTRDISTTKRDANGRIKQPQATFIDWGIFGLGYCPGPSCIVSTFRFKHSNKSLFINRLKKICIHELGHNLGLKHCPTPHCVMNDAAEKISTIDRAKMALCKKCKDQIR